MKIPTAHNLLSAGKLFGQWWIKKGNPLPTIYTCDNVALDSGLRRCNTTLLVTPRCILADNVTVHPIDRDAGALTQAIHQRIATNDRSLGDMNGPMGYLAIHGNKHH